MSKTFSIYKSKRKKVFHQPLVIFPEKDESNVKNVAKAISLSSQANSGTLQWDNLRQ